MTDRPRDRHLAPVPIPDDDPDGGHQQPPQDLAAERATLGGMLLSRHVIDDCLDTVTGPEFHRPAHELIFDAIAALHFSGDIADPVTVADHLTRTGNLTRAGGAAYLHELTAATPVAESASHYARIVAERAAQRRLVEAGTRIVQLGYAPTGGNITDLYQAATTELEHAGSALHATRDTPSTWAPVDLTPILDHGEKLEQPTQLARNDGQHLLYPAAVHSISGEPESGKAQPYSALVQTPTGPKRMGELVVGDTILGLDGHAQTVTAIHERGERDVWQVTTSTGQTVECCDEHLWNVQDHNDRVRKPGHWRTLTTAQIATTVRTAAGRARWHLPLPAASHYESAGDLPVDPYLLGILLGDGCLTRREVLLSSADDEITASAVALAPHGTEIRAIGAYDYRLVTPRGQVNALLESLAELGLIGTRSHTKFVPSAYMRASIAERTALLQGLLDTDGSVVNGVGVEFCTTSPRLAQQVAELTQGLGGLVSTTWRRTAASGKPGRMSARLYLRLPMDLEPFRLARKAQAYTRPAAPQSHIASVTNTGRREPMRCIAVSNPDRLYLTDGHVPTHNTWVALIAAAQALRDGEHVTYVDFEDRAGRVVARLVNLGAPRQAILDRFHYIRPTVALDPAGRKHLDHCTAQSSLAVIDGVTEAMTMHGLSLLDNEDAARYLDLLPRHLADLGPAVLQIDHVVKDAEKQGRWAIGAGHKLAGLDGAAYGVKVLEPFGRGKIGRAAIAVHKDRPGAVREIALGNAVAHLVIDSRGDSMAAWLEEPSTMPKSADGGLRPTHLMEKVSRFVETTPGASRKQIEDGVQGKASYVRLAIDALVREGYITVTAGSRGTHNHSLIATFREDETDAS